LYIR